MIVDTAGEIIVDILTLSPSLSKIPSASALLDTSNFTFQAITYGKDVSGFNNHAHAVYDSNFSAIIVRAYEPTSVYSYHSSGIAAYKALYNLIPEYPDPINTRLEQKSCRTIFNNMFSGLDVGHCANHAILSAYSSTYQTLGCFAPSGGINYYVLSSDPVSGSLANTFYSGILSGTYNASGLMDGNGFLTFAPLNGSLGRLNTVNGNFGSGVLINLATNFSSTGTVDLVWRLYAHDAAALLLYGGVYHLGLWCLDIKQMLKEGHKPPFAFNPLNNIRKYRLFAKKTFTKDLLNLNDYSGLNAFKLLLEGKLASYLVYQWTIRFL